MIYFMEVLEAEIWRGGPVWWSSVPAAPERCLGQSRYSEDLCYDAFQALPGTQKTGLTMPSPPVKASHPPLPPLVFLVAVLVLDNEL